MLKEGKKINIAIQIVTPEMNHPYDRRRVTPFLKDFNKESLICYQPFLDIKEIELELFDFVVVSIRSDLPFIYKLLSSIEKPTDTKFIFDYCDFIHVTNSFHFFLKSFFAKKRDNYSNFFSKKKFMKLVSLFDVIVVGSEAQKKIITKFNTKTFVIPDISEEIPLLDIKKNLEISGILWEGFASSNWLIFKKLFKYANTISTKSTLYIVTDQKYYIIAGKYLGVRINKVFKYFNFFYQKLDFETKSWNVDNLIHFASKCSIAMIPISDNKIARLKPENKIVIMIRLGLLPIVSNIPAYKEFSKKYDLDICFSNFNDFNRVLSNIDSTFLKLKEVRLEILNDYSYLNIKSKWKNIFEL